MPLRWVRDKTSSWWLLMAACLALLKHVCVCGFGCVCTCRCCLLSVDAQALPCIPGCHTSSPLYAELGSQHTELQITAVRVQPPGNQTSECVSVCQRHSEFFQNRVRLKAELSARHLFSPAHTCSITDKGGLHNVCGILAVVQILLHQ